MSESSTLSTEPWSKLYIVVGTYDGALAGWELQHQRATDETTSTVIATKPLVKSKRKNRNINDDDHDDDNINNRSSNNRLTLTFATASHDGSVRCLCFSSPTVASSSLQQHKSTETTATSTTTLLPGALLSCGFDEMIRTHDWTKRKTGLGEVRTPSDFGTPLCASFAPPPPPLSSSTGINSSTTSSSTHALVGFSKGKIVIYKKRDWSIQHVLAGHEGGVSTLAVHPSGTLALSGGQSDGKLKLWDLTKGRLAYATTTTAVQQAQNSKQRRSVGILPPITSLVWSPDGTAYGYCHGTHITVRHVETGKDLLDVDDMPSRVNQIALLAVDEGLFVAAACDDGSLPVLAVQLTRNDDDEDDDNQTRRAIMAIEPVENAVVAGEERFKCIQLVSDYHVVTTNSAGVVSLMNLKGAIQMITKPNENELEDSEDDDEERSDNDDNVDSKDKQRHNRDDEELAVDIIDSVQLGQGARITCLGVWAQPTAMTPKDTTVTESTMGENCDNDDDEAIHQNENDDEEVPKEHEKDEEEEKGNKRNKKGQVIGGDKRSRTTARIDMDSDAITRARELVTKAKEMQRKRNRKRQKKNSKA